MTCPDLVCSDLGEDAPHGGNLLLAVRVRRVYHQKHQIRGPDLGKRRLESLHQGRRELLDEADRIGNGDLAALVEDHGPRRWVERRKELVLGINLRPREPVEKRRLASIRVAHQRHAVDSRVPARLALDPAPHLEPLELPPEVGDLVPHQATVNLKLALALTKAAADSTPGLLADEVAPHAPKARQDVLELRKLHLQASLARPSMNAKDVEDERGSVDRS